VADHDPAYAINSTHHAEPARTRPRHEENEMSEHPDNPPQGQWHPTNPPAPPAPAVAKPNWFMRHKILTGLAGLLLFGAVSSALGGGGDAPSDASSEPTTTTASPAAAPTQTGAAKPVAKPTAKPAAKKAPAIGTKVRDGKFEFVVTAVEDGGAEVGSDGFGEKAQGRFTFVRLTITNIGDKPQTMFTDNQTVVDAQGRTFTPNSMAGIHLEDNDVWISEINPGNSVKGTLVYDMPKGSKPTSIELHDSMFSGGVNVSLT
jgi:hypothetical protein